MKFSFFNRNLAPICLLFIACSFAQSSDFDSTSLFEPNSSAINSNAGIVVQDLIDKVGNRFKCSQFGLLQTDCVKCLNASRILSVLQIDPKRTSFSKQNVEDLATVFLHHVINFPSLCSTQPPGCSNFVTCKFELFDRIRANDLPDSVNELMKDVRKTLQLDSPNQCIQAHDIIEELQIADHETSNEHKVQNVVTTLMWHIFKGHCLSVAGGESTTDFLDDIFNLYGEKCSTTISVNGLKRIVEDLQSKGSNNHDHSHGHNHDHNHDHSHGHNHDHIDEESGCEERYQRLTRDHDHSNHAHHDHNHDHSNHLHNDRDHDHSHDSTGKIIGHHHNHSDHDHSHDSRGKIIGHHHNHSDHDHVSREHEHEHHGSEHNHDDTVHNHDSEHSHNNTEHMHDGMEHNHDDFEHNHDNREPKHNDTEHIHNGVEHSDGGIEHNHDENGHTQHNAEFTHASLKNDLNHSSIINHTDSHSSSMPFNNGMKNAKHGASSISSSAVDTPDDFADPSSTATTKFHSGYTSESVRGTLTQASALKSELFHQEDIGGGNTLRFPNDNLQRVYLLRNEENKNSVDGELDLHQRDNLAQKCLTIEELVAKFGYSSNGSFSKVDFLQLCPALVQQIVSGVCANPIAPSQDQPSVLELYGYSSLAVLLISLTSLAGVVLFPIINKDAYPYVMAGFVGLAFSTLAGDALLHLLPQALGVHSHADANHSHADEGLDPTVWRILGMFGTIYLLFLFEAISCAFSTNGHIHSHGNNGHGHSHVPDSLPKELTLVSVKVKCDSNTQLAMTPDPSVSSLNTEIAEIEESKKPEPMMLSRPVFMGMTMVAVMVTLGDSIHNFGDGLAIGAAFSSGIRGGLSTSIAVFCHELPHEFGDFVILLSTGLSFSKALWINFISGLTCFFGLYIGILLGDNETFRVWIITLISGIFLYVSLSQMLPGLKEHRKGDSPKMLLVKNIGILIGIGIMLLISIYEHQFYV